MGPVWKVWCRSALAYHTDRSGRLIDLANDIIIIVSLFYNPTGNNNIYSVLAVRSHAA